MVDMVSINCLLNLIKTQMTLIFKMLIFQKIVEEKDKFYWQNLNNNNSNKKTNRRIIDMKYRSKGKANIWVNNCKLEEKTTQHIDKKYIYAKYHNRSMCILLISKNAIELTILCHSVTVLKVKNNIKIWSSLQQQKIKNVFNHYLRELTPFHTFIILNIAQTNTEEVISLEYRQDNWWT